ncbi:MAG: leucyl aminopeptidase [bacterium]
MISVQLTQKKFWENDVECYIFLMTENLESASDLATLDKVENDFYPHVKEILKKHKFNGKHGQNFVLTAMHDSSEGSKKLIQFMFIGLGKLNNSWHRELELLRRAFAGAIERMKGLVIQNAVVALPDVKMFNVHAAELVKQLTIVAFMADYEFIKFKSDKKDKEWVGTLLIETDPKDHSMFIQALQQGTIIGQAVNQARNWADLPANILTPSELAKEAKQIADEFNLQCMVFGEQKAKELGMGGFLCVDAGSDQPGKFVVLEYNTSVENAPTIALVGKGVCFDTGGVSLKPSDSMHGMKFDMTGAAAVIATMKVFAQLKPNVNVVGVMPLVENMPSGKAARQDDIVTFMNGKTAEIRSTDAEGRLILADALHYAEKNYNPEVMIDIATLTGACAYSLGHFYSAIMTRDQALCDTLSAVGKLTGDKVWQLPLEDDYKDAIRSDVADISNTGSKAYLAGTVTATCFLENFVEKTRWAHLDVAGTADGVPGVNYMGKGASGVGVRLFVEFVMNYKKS